MEQEVALWSDVSKGTRLEYERKFQQLKDGKWDLSTARKGTRYAMRAAGLYVMRKQLKKLIKEIKETMRDYSKGKLGYSEYNKLYLEKMIAGGKKLNEIKKFTDMAWNEIEDKKAHYLEADHKKKPATDAQLLAFYESAQRSSFKEAFLVCEFSGARPEEIAKGVRIELVRVDGVPALRFHIESAKCDGNKKGIELRTVDVKAPPKTASKEVRERFKELARIVADGGKRKSWVCTVEPTTGKNPMPGARRLTNAFATTAKAAGVSISAYSMRHRFSAQAKQANPGDSVTVAMLLGHQSTATQGHYARASRGAGSVSPSNVASGGISPGVQIRGEASRAGPPKHVQEHALLEKSIPPAQALRPATPRPRL
jgi:integrase